MQTNRSSKKEKNWERQNTKLGETEQLAILEKSQFIVVSFLQFDVTCEFPQMKT